MAHRIHSRQEKLKLYKKLTITIEWEIETYKNTIADTKKILMIE